MADQIIHDLEVNQGYEVQPLKTERVEGHLMVLAKVPGCDAIVRLGISRVMGGVVVYYVYKVGDEQFEKLAPGASRANLSAEQLKATVPPEKLGCGASVATSTGGFSGVLWLSITSTLEHQKYQEPFMYRHLPGGRIGVNTTVEGCAATVTLAFNKDVQGTPTGYTVYWIDGTAPNTALAISREDLSLSAETLKKAAPELLRCAPLAIATSAPASS